jgi:hypothetical protein
MMMPPRTSLLRGPLLVVVMFVLALLALYPGASLRAQRAPAASASSLPARQVDGEVTDMYVKRKQLEVVYRNTGTVATDIVGEVQVRDAEGELVATVTLVEARRVDARRTEKFRVAMPELPPGSYTIYAVVDFGGPELTAAEAALEIRP